MSAGDLMAAIPAGARAIPDARTANVRTPRRPGTRRGYGTDRGA